VYFHINGYPLSGNAPWLALLWYFTLSNARILYSVLHQTIWQLKSAATQFVTVYAMEVLIKYCMNIIPQVDQFIRIQILFTSCAFPIGESVLKRNLIGSSKSNRKLINFLSNELSNLRKGIAAIFYQHFHCIDSNTTTY
jgi:hypothetical protein